VAAVRRRRWRPVARRRPATAASARRSDSSGGEPRTTGRRLRTGRARGRDGVREARRGDGVDSGAQSGGLSGRRRAVPTAPLRRKSGAVRHGCVAATRRRCADRRAQRGKRWLTGGPHSSVFSVLKINPG
jgi:hypothetical protein